MRPSTQSPNGHLEGLLKLVIAVLLIVNLLLVLPTQVTSIRLDLIHPSLPAVPLDRLRLTNSPFLKKLFLRVKKRNISQSTLQPSIWVGRAAMPTEGFVTDSFANAATGGPATAQTSTPGARPTSMSTHTPSPTPPVSSPTVGSMTEYYVSPAGDDSNPGTIDRPWRTLSRVHTAHFLPGDVVSFARGGSWSGGLRINDSGVQDNTITFTAYGTGDRPVFTNPGNAGSYTRAVEIDADWVVVEDLLVQDAHEAGVYISNGSDYNIVRDIEATNVGIGIAIHGQHNLATQDYLHDLRMVVDTPGGNDDYGAVGIWLFNSNNEVSYNRMVNCKASSHDYGTDGGAVEWHGAADNNYVHHNWAEDSAGFLEVGGGSSKNSIVAYNVSVNNGRLSWIHLSGEFASVVKNFRVENNTIVETSGSGGWVVLGFNGDPTENTFVLRNNIFYVDGFDYVAATSRFTHDHNLYYLGGGTQLGFSLEEGEETTDPLFVNLAARDLHLQSDSPAIDSGIDLGYSLDFDHRPVPQGSAPDIGAFER